MRGASEARRGYGASQKSMLELIKSFGLICEMTNRARANKIRRSCVEGRLN